MSTSYLLAWLLPLFTGSGLWWLVHGPRRFRGDVVASLGCGWLIGVLLAAFCARWQAQADTVHAVQLAAPWLAGLGALAWLGAAWRLWRGAATLPRSPSETMSPLWRTLWWLLLALIVVRLGLLGAEAALRPIFPWDAWAAWAVRPKAWMLLGHADAYVSMSEWLAQPWAPTRTMMAWTYPELLAWIEVWFASGAGGWDEPRVNLAWCGALAALALALYGHARGLGVRAGVAMLLGYALVSLPLIDAHVALAGYADLWLAATSGLALLAWSRWLLFRERGQALLGLALALCLPALKLEGTVWLLAFAAIVVLDRIPSRWRGWSVALAIGLLAIGLAMGGFSLPLPGLGNVAIAWDRVIIPGVATYQLSWHAVGGSMLDSLFTLPNWHLLWYVLPMLVALRWRRVLGDRATRVLGALVLMQLLFLFLLFTVTSAAEWARDFTSANRLLLQVVPTLFVFVAVLLRDAGAAAIEENVGESIPPRKAPRLAQAAPSTSR